MTKEEVYEDMTFSNKNYREIITKAVCGKGHTCETSVHTICPSHKPSSILGCWIINHSYSAKKKSKEAVEIYGSYDVNVWYSFNNNTSTEVVVERVEYCDVVPLSSMDEQCAEATYDVIANVIRQPNCLECKICKKGENVLVEVEREFEVKVIGETSLTVCVEQSHGHGHHKHTITDDDVRHINPHFSHHKKND